MSDQENSANQIDDLEIEALSDEDLESVAGGAEDCNRNSCSKRDCSGGGDDTIGIDVELPDITP